MNTMAEKLNLIFSKAYSLNRSIQLVELFIINYQCRIENQKLSKRWETYFILPISI